MSKYISIEDKNNLASYLAEALDDREAIALHKRLVEKHPGEVLMEILSYVLNQPKSSIRSSRAAYFNYLVMLYERTGKHPRP
jgi:hypothetical protein